MSDELDSIVRGATAVLCGVMLGLPYRRRPGGISTHVLVALGACFYTIVAHRTGEDSWAAAVIKTRAYIVGINTAASIWIAGALGCMVVLEHPARAVAFAAATAVLNAVIRRVERRVIGRAHRIPAITSTQAPSR